MKITRTMAHLANVLEWAKGQRGRTDVNPYGVPEIEGALRHMAQETETGGWLEVDTEAISKSQKRPLTEAERLALKLMDPKREEFRYGEEFHQGCSE